MSGLAGLFGTGVKVDKADFKYDPNKQKKTTAQPQQPQFPFQAQVQLFKFDQASNSNKGVGAVIFLVRPVPPAYQIFAYQNQAQPIIALQVTTAINFQLRNKIYGYLVDAQNVQWTIQFPDASTAARCAVTLVAVLTGSDGKKMEKMDVGVGSGEFVGPEDKVNVSYIGFFGNQLPHTQAQFDASEDYNFVIGAENVIKGYSEGVDGMRVGGTRAIIVPPELGYGANGVRGAIPANSTLTFLITLKSATTTGKAGEQQAAPVAAPAQPPTTMERVQRSGVAIPAAGQALAQQQQSQSQSDAEEAPRRRLSNTQPSDHSEGRRGSRTKKKNLFDDDDDEEAAPRAGMSVMPTMDENEMLARIDQLNELIRSKFDSLAVTAPVTMKPGDVVYEVQALAAEIEDKERQLREQQQIIDELKKTKQNSRLRAELDVAQTELASLRSVLKGGRDFRKENDELKAELRHIKETKLAEMESDLAELRTQLARSHDISQAAAATKTKELFFAFLGAAMEKMNTRLAGVESMVPKDITSVIYEVFRQCSEEIFKQIDENGII